MKISSADIDILVSQMERYLEDGFYDMSYLKSTNNLKIQDISFFDNEFDKAVHRSYNPDHNIAPVNAVLEVLQIIQSKASVLPQSWSLPIDIAQINYNYQLGIKFKNTIMEIENVKKEDLTPLAKTLLYTGMGKISFEELNEKVAQGQEVFKIGFTQDFKEGSAVVSANCAKSGVGKYYPDTYDIVVKQEGKPVIERSYKFRGRIPVPNGTDKPEQINPTITLKEAYNQMMGRGVHKTFVREDIKEPKNNRKYEAWEYINFSQTDDKGNYKTEKFFDLDIDKKLKSLSLVANKDDDNFKELSNSLKRGNIQETKYISLDGTQESIYLEANARFNTINAYDKDMNPISLHEKRQQEIEAIEQKKKAETQKEDNNQGQTQDNKQAAPEKNQQGQKDKSQGQKEGQQQADEKKSTGKRVRSA